MIPLPGGREIGCVDQGPTDGPAVVLVHGMPGNVRDFKYLAPEMVGPLRTICVDLPGFGTTPPNGLEVDDLARALLRLVAALELRRPILAGHSYGGIVATAAADLDAAAVGGVGLICSPGLRVHRGLRRIPRKLIGRALSSRWRQPASPWLVRAMHRSGFSRRLRDDEHIRCLEVIARYRPEVHRARLLRQVHPTLQAWCDDDPFIEKELSEELDTLLRRRLKPSHHVAIAYPSGGHNPQKNHAAALGEALTRFADAHAGRPPRSPNPDH